MPSKSEKQAKFMRAVAHGWKPQYVKAPPVSVAREFVEADQAAGMFEGGLAPMNDIQQRGFAPGLTGTAQSFQEGGEVEGLTFKQLIKRMGGGLGGAIRVARAIEEGEYFHDKEAGLFYPSGLTMTGESAITTPGYDPYYGRGPGRTGPRGGGRGGGRDGRGGRGRRDGGGRRTPPGEPPDPVIPPGRPPGGGLTPPVTPPDYTPPDRRAGRDTAYSRALRAHRERVAATLGVPSGYAGGGEVRGYAEGGTARADNPYPRGSNRWRVWERKHGRDPNEPDSTYEEKPEPAIREEEQAVSWLDRIMGKKEAVETKTEKALEELEEARGGYVGYQMGGYARAPMGGVPPQVAGRMRPRVGGIPPRMDPRAMPPIPTGGLQQVTGGPGSPPMGMNMPIKSRPLTVPPTMPPGGMGEPPMIDGGPRIPPNLRGYLQRARMMNRPRRGVPGPAGAGGAPNRVGMADQQGGLARALQRGTGRPPMSRRQGFYR